MKGVMLQLPDDLHLLIVSAKGTKSMQTFIVDALRKYFEEVPE